MSIPMILPGAVIDLMARTKGAILPPGRYRITAEVTARGRRVRLNQAFTLYAPNTVATRAGRLVDAVAEAEPGRTGEARARWTNRGNVAFSARVVAEVRAIGSGGTGEVLHRADLRSQRVEPGAGADTHGELPPLPTGSYEVTFRLLDGARELDRRTIGLTPAARRSLGARIHGWLSVHPLWLPGALLALLGLVLAAALRRERRTRQRLERLEDLLLGVARPSPRPTADAVLAETAAALDLNSATVEDLVRIPGIGPRGAHRIVASRTADGRYGSVDDLVRVEGFGQIRVRKLRDRLSA
jgi:competence protein ComEA